MRVRDLGPLLIDVDGVTRPVSGAKQIAILSRLAVDANQRVSIEELVEAVWGLDARVPSSTVENHVWRLRRFLEPARTDRAWRYVASDSGGYRLVASVDELDSLAFGQLADNARSSATAGSYAQALWDCEAALSLWRGSPYESIAHAPMAAAVIARCEELHAQLGEWRVDALLATGDTERALLDLEVLTAKFPFRERLWAQRMTGLSRAGRNEEALQTYSRARAVLLDELGLEPGAELRELQRAIISQETSVAEDIAAPVGSESRQYRLLRPPVTTEPERHDGYPAAHQFEWPLIGRAEELEQIGVARREGRCGAAVHGPAGVGRSRIAQEALAAAEHDGAGVVRVLATRSAAAVPLGAFADVLPSEVRSTDLFTLLQRSTAALRELAGRRPLVLGVDDAHLLDPVSAALVLHMATSGGAFVVAAVRDQEPTPDAITSLWKDAGARQIAVATLDEPETGQLVEAMLGGPVERAARQWIFTISGGNPLHVRELVRSAQADELFERVSGLWRLRRRPQVASSLVELVSDTVAGLDESHRAVLELLALGEPLRLAEVIDIAGLDAVMALETSGLLRLDGTSDDSRATLSSPLYGEVLRSRLPALRARHLRASLIAVLGGRAELSAEDTLRLVRWQIDAGQQVPVDRLLSAARTANTSGDPRFGADLASRAKVAGADVEADLLLARAHVMQRQYEQAAQILLTAEPNLRTQDQASIYLETQSEVLHWGLQRPAVLKELLERAVRWWPEPEWRRRVEPLRVRVASFEQLGALAAAAGGVPAEVASESDPPVDATHVGNLFYSGATVAARTLALRLRPDPPLRDLNAAIALSLWARITLETGEDWPELDAWMQDLLERSVRVQDPAAAGQAAYTLAGLRLAGARYADTTAFLAEAERQFEQRDLLGLLPVVLAMRVTAAHFTGDTRTAQVAMQACRASLDGSDPLAHQLPYVARAEAWALYDSSDGAAAQRRLLDVAGELSASPVHVARLTYEAMRAGAAAHNIAPTLELTRQRCDAPLVAAYAEHAVARAAGDGVALLAVAERMAATGAVQYAVEAAAHAAAAFAARGLFADARRALDRSRSLTPDGQGGLALAVDDIEERAPNFAERS